MPIHVFTRAERDAQKKSINEIYARSEYAERDKREARRAERSSSSSQQPTHTTSPEETSMKSTSTGKTKTEKMVDKKNSLNAIGARIGSLKDAAYQALLQGGTFEQLMAQVKKMQPKAKEDSVRWYISDIKNHDKVLVAVADGKYSVGKSALKAAAPKTTAPKATASKKTAPKATAPKTVAPKAAANKSTSLLAK